MHRGSVAGWLLVSLVSGLSPLPALAQTTACERSEFTLVERHLHDAIVDVGYPEQDSIGDLMIWANAVFDSENAATLGDVSGWCLRTSVGKMWECSFTLALADGRISAAGTALDGEDSAFAVTGGTGAYLGAAGQVTIRARGQGGLYKYDFVLLCPRAP